MDHQIYCYFDGACYPDNPGGTIGIGCVVYNNNHSFELSKRIPAAASNTNNIAEYLSLFSLLQLLIKNNLQQKSILVSGDSILVINQINGKWKTKKPHIRKLYEDCIKLVRQFNHIDFQWVPREQNTVADRLSNE